MPLVNVLLPITIKTADGVRSFQPGQHMVTADEMTAPGMDRHAKPVTACSAAEIGEANRNAAMIRVSGLPFVPPPVFGGLTQTQSANADPSEQHEA